MSRLWSTFRHEDSKRYNPAGELIQADYSPWGGWV